jgi:flavin-dependent dehydrogenase
MDRQQEADTAVVVGASIAGLLAARVLADHFARVVILERDMLPERPESRKGVPQGRHAHALLGQGRQIMEQLLPA